MFRHRLFVLLLLLVVGVKLHAQLDSIIAKYATTVENMPDKLLKKIDEKYLAIDQNIEKKTSKLLGKMQQQEAKLQKQLAKLDSNKANQLFNNSQQYYTNLTNKLKNKTGKLQQLNQYIPGIDSLSTATKFLENMGTKMQGLSPQKLAQFKQLNSVLSNTQSSIQNATDIRKLLSERKQQLQQALQQYNVGKQFKRMNKEIFYYQEQLKEYKELLGNQAKLEQRLLTAVRELPAFKTFMQKNSFLASLFPMPNNAGTMQALAGLQTRASIQEDLAARIGNGGNINANQFMQQQMQTAKKELDNIKNKLNELGGGSTEVEMPNFKPNKQKVKTFWQRLEYGANVQSQKTNVLLPTTTDFALTVGYKLNDKATIGFGASYKLGWGEGLRNISLSNQGIGLRSYIDAKLPTILKGVLEGFYITGGYEQNYLPQLNEKLEPFNIPNLRSTVWQQSGLIGLTKKYKIGKKTQNLQLLWDFLSYEQVPRTPALKFRVGYVF